MNRRTAEVLHAVLACADGAPTLAWLVAYTERPHETVRRHVHALRDAGLVSLFWSSDGVAGGYRVVATPHGRAAVLEAIAA